jgi:hypothetical protein
VFPVRYEHLHIKNAIPITGRGGVQGCEVLGIPHCLDNQLIYGNMVVSLTKRPRSRLLTNNSLLLVLISIRYYANSRV